MTDPWRCKGSNRADRQPQQIAPTVLSSACCTVLPGALVAGQGFASIILGPPRFVKFDARTTLTRVVVSFNHLISLREQRGLDCHVQRLGRPEIYYHLIFCWCLYRKVSRRP